MNLVFFYRERLTQSICGFFVHMSAFDNPDINPLTQLDAFKAFTAGIKDRCVEMPESVELQQVGRFDHLA